MSIENLSSELKKSSFVNVKNLIHSFDILVLNTLEREMASREYSTVSYHATKDDAKESIPEVLVHDAKDRENSGGNGEFF